MTGHSTPNDSIGKQWRKNVLVRLPSHLNVVAGVIDVHLTANPKALGKIDARFNAEESAWEYATRVVGL